MSPEQLIDHLRSMPRASRLAFYKALPPGVLTALINPDKVIATLIKATRSSGVAPTGSVAGEGRRLLYAALQKTTGRYLARRIGVSAMAISRWASGQGKPTRYRDRAALARAIGVPVDSW